MTQYPINLVYDRRDPLSHEGFAATEAEACAVVTADRGDEWNVTGAALETREVGVTCRTAEEFSEHWQPEIDAGWVQIIHVHGGYRGEATFWATREEEIEVE